jgi:hypothetical protein
MAMHAALGKVIHNLNPYSQTMEFPQPQASPTATAGKAPIDQNVAQIQVEIDDYKGEWAYRGQLHQIKRSLRVTYRYPVLDKKGKATGIYATEHLLIGYAGGDGN